jgi:hypothetical protein
MTQRKSTPDLRLPVELLASEPSAGIPTSLGFDSLKSLPTTLPWAAATPGAAGGAAAGDGEQQGRELLQDTAELVAGLLRERLRLTLFGFDVVISDAGGWYCCFGG